MEPQVHFLERDQRAGQGRKGLSWGRSEQASGVLGPSRAVKVGTGVPRTMQVPIYLTDAWTELPEVGC